MGSLYSCKRKISENKKSFVLLEQIRSQISLTWESSLKLANNLSAVLLSNKMRNYCFRKVHIGIGKIYLPKKINYLKKIVLNA